jgi:hypothetical protein
MKRFEGTGGTKAELLSISVAFVAGNTIWALLVILTERLSVTVIILMLLAAAMTLAAVLRAIRLRRPTTRGR